MFSWSFRALRMTAKKCVSLDMSQTFSLLQASQCHFISSMKPLYHEVGRRAVYRILAQLRECLSGGPCRANTATNAKSYAIRRCRPSLR
jgi:hypothetical protein